MRIRRHAFRGWQQRYDRVEGVMSSGLNRGNILKADSFLVEASQLWPTALAVYQRDPLYFVDAIPDQR